VKQDPLALAFFGAALAVLAGLLLYVFVFKTPEPKLAASAGSPVRAFAFLQELIREKLAEKPAAKPAPPLPVAAPAPVAKSAPPARAVKPAPAAKAPPPAPASTVEAGRSWRYAVVVEPPAWRDITLTYRAQREADGSIGVLTDFLHAKGKTNFHLGIFAPGHPSHENTRFPGFFMYGAYLKQPLNVGDAVRFGWHWQGRSAASTKRYEGEMKSWDEVTVPAGTFRAAMIEGTWTYTEDGQFRGRAYEKFWYAPKVSQIVKIMRFGISPDEGSKQIDAELVEIR